jgi:hypothetical protein
MILIRIFLLTLLVALPSLVSAKVFHAKKDSHGNYVDKSGKIVWSREQAVAAAKFAVEEKARRDSERAATAEVAKAEAAKVATAPDAQKDHGEAIPPSNNPATKATEAPAATDKTSKEKMVYIFNKGPYTVEVQEVGGKANAHDSIKPLHIGRFRYEGYESIVLGAKIVKESGWFSGKVSEQAPAPFSNGAWLVIVEGEKVTSSQDLSLLPRRN